MKHCWFSFAAFPCPADGDEVPQKDIVRWKPRKLDGHGEWTVAPRYRILPSQVPQGAEDLGAVLRNRSELGRNLPEELTDIYQFYSSKVKEDVAIEKVIVEQLERVSWLITLLRWLPEMI